jgi:hypothetical protein
VSNILKNPTEEKFRVLKTSNKTIQAKLMALKPTEKVLELLEALGYQKMDEDMHAFVGDHFVVLNLGARIIDEESMQIKMLTMSEEDRKKQQLIIDNKKAYMAKAKAEAEHKRILQENSMKDRKEKAKEIQPASHGNKLNFGANLVKFEPPKESRGG